MCPKACHYAHGRKIRYILRPPYLLRIVPGIETGRALYNRVFMRICLDLESDRGHHNPCRYLHLYLALKG